MSMMVVYIIGELRPPRSRFIHDRSFHCEIIESLPDKNDTIEKIRTKLLDPYTVSVNPPGTFYVDEQFACWRFIDVYGDTIFNHLQLPLFIKESEFLLKGIEDAKDRAFMLELIEMAKKCRQGATKGRPWYLYIEGD